MLSYIYSLFNYTARSSDKILSRIKIINELELTAKEEIIASLGYDIGVCIRD
jgi:hypothetical protein